MHDRKERALTVHVSPQGQDGWTGRLPEPQDGGRDGPLATLERARDVVRQARAAGQAGPVNVLLRGGAYVRDKPLVLGPEDGGTNGAPVTWAAYRDEIPCLDGGRRIEGWARFDGDLPGLPKKAVGCVWAAAIETGWHFSRLFWDGQDLPRSLSVAGDDWHAWPICQLGSKPDAEVVVPASSLPPAGDGENADLNFMPTPYTRWANAVTPVREIRRDTVAIRFVPVKLARPDRIKDIPFRLENLAAGLTGPGRWYVDSRRGRLYLWPPDNAAPSAHRVTAPCLTEAIRVEGDADGGRPVRWLTLRGLTIRNVGEARPETSVPYDGVASALILNGVEDCAVERLTVTNVEGWAITAGPYARRVSIGHCGVVGAGAGGIRLAGKVMAGPFICEGNRIEDNTVQHCGLRYWHSAGISVAAAAETLISHNLVDDMPYIGISSSGAARHTYFRGWPRPFPELEAIWREHGQGAPTIDGVKPFIPGHNRIEKNIVHHVMQTLDDGAAIYCHAGHHEEVRNNVVYAVIGRFGLGLYFDDEQMDSLMEGNLVYRCPEREAPGGHVAAIHLHHNGRNRVINNVLVGGRQLLSVANGYGGHVIERNVFVWSGDPNWDGADPRPVHGAGDGRRQVGWDAGPSVARSNLWWHTQGQAAADRLLSVWRSRGYGQGSKAADPMFRDPATEDYRLKEGSPAYALGFQPLDIADAGPRP